MVPEKECALVLGANKSGKNGINKYFQYRMEAAADLYFHKKEKKIIVSGDNHIKCYDETTDMAEYLIGLGIPDSVIIRDYAGFRTLDSVVRSKKRPLRWIRRPSQNLPASSARSESTLTKR